MLFRVWAFLEIFHLISFYPFKSSSFCRFVTLLSNWNSVPAKYAEMSKKYLEKCHFTIKYCEILPFNLCAQFGLPQNPNFKLVVKWRNIKPLPPASSPFCIMHAAQPNLYNSSLPREEGQSDYNWTQ